MKLSERQKLLVHLQKLFKYFVVFGDKRHAEIIAEMRCAVLSTRYLSARPKYNVVSRVQGYWQSYLMDMPDDQFHLETRCDKRSFLCIMDLIADDSVFVSSGTKPQRPICIQLFCALQCLGHDGTGNSGGIISGQKGIGRGTVSNYFQRIVSALFRLRDRVIVWPSLKTRLAHSARTLDKYGFAAFCVLDGTHVYFSQAPAVDPHQFWTRKKGKYGLLVQLLADFDWNIIGYVVGWPGCTSDITAYENSIYYTDYKLFFGDLYCLADKGYNLHTSCLVPYLEPEIEGNSERNLFNDGIKKGRLLIERINAMLKNRFVFLKGMRMQVKQKHGGGQFVDFEAANRICVACFVLHNVMNVCHDRWPDDTPPACDAYANAYQALLGDVAGSSSSESASQFRELQLQLHSEWHARQFYTPSFARM